MSTLKAIKEYILERYDSDSWCDCDIGSEVVSQLETLFQKEQSEQPLQKSVGYYYPKRKTAYSTC